MDEKAQKMKCTFVYIKLMPTNFRKTQRNSRRCFTGET